MSLLWGSVSFVAAYDALGILGQYQLWRSGDVTQFLLPEYQSGYFFFYSFYRILAPHLLALIFALFLILLLKRVNQRHDNLFFEEEEPVLAGLSLFWVSYPGLIVYLVVLLGGYLLWHTFNRLRGKGRERLPLYRLWPSAGILTILLIQSWLGQTALWNSLRV